MIRRRQTPKRARRGRPPAAAALADIESTAIDSSSSFVGCPPLEKKRAKVAFKFPRQLFFAHILFPIQHQKELDDVTFSSLCHFHGFSIHLGGDSGTFINIPRTNPPAEKYPPPLSSVPTALNSYPPLLGLPDFILTIQLLYPFVGGGFLLVRWGGGGFGFFGGFWSEATATAGTHTSKRRTVAPGATDFHRSFRRMTSL